MNEERAKEVLLNYEKTKRELDRQTKRMAEMGSFLADLGNRLVNEPERVLFEGQEYHLTEWGQLSLVTGSYLEAINVDLLKMETSKTRELKERFKRLEEQKRELEL